ncbi:hypothetical protein RhiirA5_436669 [Rhizophagus irregularis]|uniref:Uncharacterized protein n=1 Tax=Rhizophagus irregularis TaxID=588596 RepID=A0A2N0NLM0_9GLOM|nr:hypothetical protein RhiirA5_436669 [Rhizophagus irregularis]
MLKVEQWVVKTNEHLLPENPLKAKEDGWVLEAISIEESQERALNPNRTAEISERKAEGKKEGRCMEEVSRTSPSSSRAIQAEVMEEGDESLVGQNEPSVYIDCTESGRILSSILSLLSLWKGERAGEARCLMADFLDKAGMLRAQPGQGL